MARLLTLDICCIYSDCHSDLRYFRLTSPLEILKQVRERFYSKDGSPVLGSNLDTWDTSITTGGNDFPELQRFISKDIMFVVVNVVGSNNNLYRTCFDLFGKTIVGCPFTLWFSDFCCFGARQEYETRDAKVNAFMRESFASAKVSDVKGVMIVAQAVIFSREHFPELLSDGFKSFYSTLEQETRSFGGPVVYVHGDRHIFQVYSPELTGIPNFTVVGVPGDNSIGWVDCTINSNSSTVFNFTHVDLTPNVDAVEDLNSCS